MQIPSRDHETLIDNLRQHVEFLAGNLGERNPFAYESLQQARLYLVESLEGMGYALDFDIYHVAGKEYQNVIAELKRAIQMMEKARGGNVIVAGNSIITVYKRG